MHSFELYMENKLHLDPMISIVLIYFSISRDEHTQRSQKRIE